MKSMFYKILNVLRLGFALISLILKRTETKEEIKLYNEQKGEDQDDSNNSSNS